VFPQIFKTAKIISIFKNGNKNLVCNYRPISLLSSLSKVLKKLIKSCLVNEKHNILCDCQYGFREKHSVLHALLDVTSLDFDAIENNKHTAMLLMDLRKAFDTVSLEILLQNYIITAYEAPHTSN